MDRKSHVAIIGGGFSGTMIAVNLFKLHTDLNITIIEPRSELGRGLAYSTPCENHLLNVTASRMSALPDEPDHFFNYAHSLDRNITPDTYVPRKIYGQYVNSLFAKELGKWQHNSKNMQHMQTKIVDIEKVDKQYHLFFSNGSSIDVDCVVLAMGNLSGNRPNWLTGLDMDNTNYIHDPWNTEAINAISADEKVLLVGSGLTAIDKIVELKSNKYKADLYVLSRHGLLPRNHIHNYQRPTPYELQCNSALAALTTIRKRIDNLKTGDWRQVIDALKSTTQKWWLSLPRHEQKRFLRHLQSYWDVYRHRMAPRIGQEIETMLQTGQIKIFAGRIISISEVNELLSIDIKERGKNSTQKIFVNKIINCTGPQSSLKTVDSPLLANLSKRGLVYPHDLGTGIAVRADGQVVNNSGQAVEGLFAIGRLQKEELMESVAVPELSQQAQNLAQKIINTIVPILLCMCLIVASSSAQAITPTKIKVDIFLDKGAHPKQLLIDTFTSDPSVSLDIINGEDIRRGCLQNADVLFMPGGSGKKEAFSIGEEGKEKIRQFTKDGGIYLGVCAGCYLASHAHPEYLGIMPLTTTDKKHWQRGKATLPIQFTPLGMEIFGVNKANATVVYHNGPVLRPYNNRDSEFSPLSYYRGEVVAPGGKVGVMVNSPAMVLSQYGNGSVLGISPHPEATPGLTRIELHAIHWLYNHRFQNKALSSSAISQVSTNATTKIVATTTSSRIYNKAEEIFEHTTNSHYEHLHEAATQQVREYNGMYETSTDCSGFVSYVLACVAPEQFDFIYRTTGHTYPHAKTYTKVFSQLNTNQPTNGWLGIGSYKELQQGDIIAWEKPQEFSRSDNHHAQSGHVMIVINPPGNIVTETFAGRIIKYVKVYVLDSSSVEHFPPQLLPPLAHQNQRDGLGKGYVRLIIDNQNKVIGYWEGTFSHEKNKVIKGPTFVNKISFARLFP